MIRDVDIAHLIVDGRRNVIGVTLTWVRRDGTSFDQTISVPDEEAPPRITVPQATAECAQHAFVGHNRESRCDTCGQSIEADVHNRARSRPEGTE